jgi:hypothetical protein
MKQFLLLVLLVVSSMAYSQDYTPNLIDYNDWINAGSVGQPLTCWGPGGPGYCGPLPAVGAFNEPSLINFSYGLTDIYQPIGIAQALSASGSGIIVNGFSFSFTAKNGNGWDNGQLDYLTAYAEFYNNNNLSESYNYDLNYKFNWTNFNFSETFTNPYQINDLDEVKVGFVGRDTNGWAGFYGPEVKNINFRLNYGIDPCYDDPLSSPSCDGFQAALLELQCNGDPLSNVGCPGFLEDFMSETDMSLDDVFDDGLYDEYSEEELYENFEDEFIADEEFLDEEFFEDEEFLEEDLLADEEFLDEEFLDEEELLDADLIAYALSILNEEPLTDDEFLEEEIVAEEDLTVDQEVQEEYLITNEDLSGEESTLSLLELVEILNSTDDKPVDSLSQSDINLIIQNEIVENITPTNISITKTDDIASPVIQENIVRVEVTRITEQNGSSDSLIVEIADQDETQVEDIISETTVDETLIVENDTEEEQGTLVVSSSNNINETNIETLLSDNTVQENNTETVVAATEQVSDEEETSVENVVAQEETNESEEITNESFDDIALISEISLDVVVTAASTFNNNSMQQVLALGGTITEILNTPVPDFSRYEVKPPSQEEEVQTAKVENTLESMSTEEIESQAELRIGSMDPESQAIALQLIGYKPGFDQYGGTIQDQQNWYQSTSVYSNNRVPTGSNQLFGAQDQRHQELMSLQYRR